MSFFDDAEWSGTDDSGSAQSPSRSFFDDVAPPPVPEPRPTIPEWAGPRPGLVAGVAWYGRGSDQHRSQRFWMWPLPPDGTLSFAVARPDFDSEELTGTFDSGSLRAASAGAEALW